MSEWIACNERLPQHNQWVVVLASNRGHCSGYLTCLAGIFHEKYYDTTINDFQLIGTYNAPWRVAYWQPLDMYSMRTIGPFHEGFEDQFAWITRAKT